MPPTPVRTNNTVNSTLECLKNFILYIAYVEVKEISKEAIKPDAKGIAILTQG